MNSDTLTLSFEEEPYTNSCLAGNTQVNFGTCINGVWLTPGLASMFFGSSTSILATGEEVGSEPAAGGICGRESSNNIQQLVEATYEANVSLVTPTRSPQPHGTNHFRRNTAPNDAASDLSGSNDTHHMLHIPKGTRV